MSLIATDEGGASRPLRYVIRVDNPAIGGSRYFNHAGKLSTEYPEAMQFATLAKAKRIAEKIGRYATVEPTEGT